MSEKTDNLIDKIRDSSFSIGSLILELLDEIKEIEKRVEDVEHEQDN